VVGEVAGRGPEVARLWAPDGNARVSSFEVALGLAIVWRIVSCGGLLVGPGEAGLVATDGDTGFAFNGNACQGEADFGVVGVSAEGEGVDCCC
jgi:hypothetical protein